MPENSNPYTALLAEADAPALAAFIAEERERFRDHFLTSPSGRAHSLLLAGLYDAAVCRLFALAVQEAEAEVQPTGVEIAIVATGGYGRRELCPHSDIDIAFIAAEEHDPYLDAVVRRMFFLIMDVFTVRLDMKVGYAFRVPEECASLDMQTRTAHLDTRRLVGSEALVRRFRAELMRTMRPAAFLYDRRAEREEAYRKHGATMHRAEPNLKEGAGGLRDLQLVEWMARAQSRRPLGDPWASLVALGDITSADRVAATEAREFLLRVRHALHYACNRPFDTLTRDRQEEVAASLGYQDVRVLMVDYYRHAETCYRVAHCVTERARLRPLPLSKGLVVQNGEITTGDPPVEWNDLSGMVALFRESQSLDMPLKRELGQRLSDWLTRIPPEPPAGAGSHAFLEILRAETGIETALRQMAHWGLLQRLIPEFGEALRLVPPAPLHEYTVGEHTLRVLSILEQARSASGRESSEYARVFSEMQRPEVLFLATILHDLGKITNPARHSEAGAGLSRDIALRLGMDPEGAAMVAFLVRHHLLMSDTARLRDLTLDQTIRNFVAVVDSVERLNGLYLLTYADLRATGGGVWTPVQERFLEDLYYRSLRALASPTSEEDIHTRVQRQRRRMQRELTLQNLAPEAVQEHCNAMPPSYLLNTPVDTIARHIRLVDRLKESSPVVEFVDEPDREFTTVILCTYDDPQPGLLSKIAAAFYAHNIDVHAAQIFTRNGEPAVALDTLWVDLDGRRLRPFERVEVERDLRDALTGKVELEALLRRRGKLPTVDLSDADIRIHNDVSDLHTVVEVRITDRRGLLYRLTHRLSELGWDIHSARINTIGLEARDAFYVTRGGEKLSESPSAIRKRLRAK